MLELMCTNSVTSERQNWSDKKRVRPRIRRGQKSAGKTCQSGLILYSCHLLFRSKLLPSVPQEAVCSNLQVQAKPAWQPLEGRVSSPETLTALPRPLADCKGLPLLRLEKREALKTDQTACTKPGHSTIPEAGPSFLSCLYLVHSLCLGFFQILHPLECVSQDPASSLVRTLWCIMKKWFTGNWVPFGFTYSICDTRAGMEDSSHFVILQHPGDRPFLRAYPSSCVCLLGPTELGAVWCHIRVEMWDSKPVPSNHVPPFLCNPKGFSFLR